LERTILKPEVQVFGERELLDRILKGEKVYSHCISIRDPNMQIPDYLPPAFKEVIELKFFDILEGQVPDKQAPTEKDAKKVIDFVIIIGPEMRLQDTPSTAGAGTPDRQLRLWQSST
jgi:predicted protein tyrosine phosphatase